MASKKNENTKKAHRMLAAYWLFNVIRSGNIPAATISALKIEGHSRKKEFLERHKSLRDVSAKSVRPAAAAGRSAVKKGKAAGNAKKDRPRGGPSKKAALRNCLKYMMKKERLF